MNSRIHNAFFVMIMGIFFLRKCVFSSLKMQREMEIQEAISSAGIFLAMSETEEMFVQHDRTFHNDRATKYVERHLRIT